MANSQPVDLVGEKMTFDDLAHGLITDYEINGKRSIRNVRIRIKKHLLPFFKNRAARSITSAEINEFILHRQELEASNGEINRELSALKRMFSLAIQAEKLARRPYIRRLDERNVRQGFVEAWEFNAILAALPTYLRPPITFAYWIGWRVQSEILPLR